MVALVTVSSHETESKVTSVTTSMQSLGTEPKIDIPLPVDKPLPTEGITDPLNDPLIPTDPLNEPLIDPLTEPLALLEPLIEPLASLEPLTDPLSPVDRLPLTDPLTEPSIDPLTLPTEPDTLPALPLSEPLTEPLSEPLLDPLPELSLLSDESLLSLLESLDESLELSLLLLDELDEQSGSHGLYSMCHLPNLSRLQMLKSSTTSQARTLKISSVFCDPLGSVTFSKYQPQMSSCSNFQMGSVATPGMNFFSPPLPEPIGPHFLHFLLGMPPLQM